MSPTTFVEQDGRRYQGWFLDDGQIHKIGEKVPWEPDFDHPGQWINGLHEVDSFAADDEEKSFFLVIQNFTLVAVHAMPDDMDRTAYRGELEDRYGSFTPPRHHWPEMSWEAALWRRELRERLWAERKKKLVEQYMQSWRLKRLQPKRSQPIHPGPERTPPLNEQLLQTLNVEPETEEEALKQANAICAVMWAEPPKP